MTPPPPNRVARRRLLAFIVLASGSAATTYACVPDYNPPGTGTADTGADTTGPSAESGADAAPSADTGPLPETGPDALDAGSISPTRNSLAVGNAQYSTFVCAMHTGSLYCWGDPANNDLGVFGFFPAEAGAAYPNPVKAITRDVPSELGLGRFHTCSLYGTDVWCRGSNQVSQRGATGGDGPDETKVLGLVDGADVIAVGGDFSCAVALHPEAGTPGNVYCWGWNGMGALGRPLSDPRSGDRAWAVVRTLADGGVDGVHDAVTVAAGMAHACVITSAGKILCWGASGYGQAGSSAGTLCSIYFGLCTPSPQEVVIPGERAVGLALGAYHSCAVTQLGNVWCWGGNDVNQLGVGQAPEGCTAPDAGSSPDAESAACSPAPVQVPGLANIVSISAGFQHTCAIGASGTTWCWGNGGAGQLGNGTTDVTPGPVVVEDINSTLPMPFDEIAAGSFRTCGRRGTDYYCWGAGVLGTAALDGSAPDYRFPALVVFP